VAGSAAAFGSESANAGEVSKALSPRIKIDLSVE